MLKKLIKHEWKDTYPVGTTCCIVVIIMTIIGMILLSLDVWNQSAGRSDAAESFTIIMFSMYFMMLFWGVIAAVLVIKYYYFYRYYKNLFTDQGYLMNTLPVKSTDLINSKLIVSVIWQYLSGIVVAFAVFGLVFAAVGNFGDITFAEFCSGLKELLDEMDWAQFGEAVPMIIVSILSGLLSPIASTLLMYVAVGIGQLCKKSKFLISVLILIGFNIVLQFVVRIFTLPLTLMMENEMPSITTINIMSVIGFIIGIAITIGLYFANKFFLEKKLNLE